MTAQRSHLLFVNLPVRDLQRSITFFTGLGFTFNSQFTDDKAACMIVSEQAFVMLLVEERFRDFARKPISDAAATTAGLYALSVDSRAQVDEMVYAAFAAGGTPAADPQDHGFMYGWSFYDPDGHHWEVLWMDPQYVMQ
jgi:uncharacterized protein